MAVSDENKALAMHLRERVGGTPAVRAYWDEDERSSVDIFSAADRPYDGIVTYSTLGLSDTTRGKEVDGVPFGAEIVMAADADWEDAPNILATCAFNKINSGFELAPHTIFEDVVAMYLPDSRMRHIFFVPPFLFNLETQYFDNKVSAWLLAVPISDSERDYADANGGEDLENLFEEKQIDVFDLDREPVL